MRGSSFGYLVREGFRNIYQNRAISIAAIGVLMACLLLVGSSVLFTLNVNAIVGYFESQNEVVVFLDDSIEGEQLTNLDAALHEVKNLAAITFVSREEGLTEWMSQLGEDGALMEWLIEDNPLQNSYRVVVEDLTHMAETVDALREIPGVDTVRASDETAQAVAGLKQTVAWGGAAIIGILVAVSLCIVANTIRITVFNRRKEIGIMKYVGATDGFIRLPFLSEGILLGFLSATLAFFLLWGGYAALGKWLIETPMQWAELITGHLVPFESVAVRMYLYFQAGGIGIGALGSGFFIGKYIKV